MTAPNVPYQLLMGHDEPDMRGQPMQKRIFFSRQLNALSVERHYPRHQIDRQRAGPHHRVTVGAAQMPTERRVAPRQQFRYPERLDDIIVRAQAEQTDFLMFVGMDGEDNDRNVRPGANS